MRQSNKFILCGLLALSSIISWAQGFEVKSYEVEVFISEEGYFDVVEKYDLNFTLDKHGIFRNIQTKYDLLTEADQKEKRKIEISNIEVPGHQFTASSSFEQRFNNFVQIKIGDPDRTVRGPISYEIRYRVEQAFLFEQEAIRFYWNLKPTQWYAPFENIKFRVHLPQSTSITRSDVFLYAGPEGFNVPTNDINLSLNEGVISGQSQSGFVSRYGDAVTILVNLPLESVAKIEPAWPFWTRYGWTLILGAIVGMFMAVFFKHGKDDPAPAITSYYPPKDIDPAMAGFLMNDSSDTRDLISLIPYWGAQGLIKVETIEKEGLFASDDTKLIKLQELPAGRIHYERKIFNGIFGSKDEVLISSLRNKFYSKMSLAKAQLKQTAQRFYIPRSKKVLGWMSALLILGIVIVLPLFLYFWSFQAALIGFGCFLVLLIINQYMIKKNKHGIRVYSELKGFKQFIKTAEEGKLKMLLEESPLYFEATMAYALSFGSFKDWAKKFDALNIPPPNWYDHSGRHHNFSHFSNSFNSSMNSARSVMVSSPSSSGSSSGGSFGGGSSGGGFGGGGGGSW